MYVTWVSFYLLFICNTIRNWAMFGPGKFERKKIEKIKNKRKERMKENKSKFKLNKLFLYVPLLYKN